jgi:hypothetical protein
MRPLRSPTAMLSAPGVTPEKQLIGASMIACFFFPCTVIIAFAALDGRDFSEGIRLPLATALGIWAVAFLVAAFRPMRVVDEPSLRAPYGLGIAGAAGVAAVIAATDATILPWLALFAVAPPLAWISGSGYVHAFRTLRRRRMNSRRR